MQVRNGGPSRTIAPRGTLTSGAQTIPLAFPAQALAHGQTVSMSTTVNVPDPALWSPTSPNLYHLALAVGSESSFSARVGLRELTWNRGRAYLNGQRLWLHGATIQEDARGHGDALTSTDEDTIVAELKAIGANAVRSQHPLDPGLLERLDAAGILVWQGVGPVEGAGNWYSNTPPLAKKREQQAQTAVLAAELHPSIIAWNLAQRGRRQRALSGRGAATCGPSTGWLHANDPTRMVAVDVWGDHPPQHAGALYSGVDAVAETDYTGWYDSPRDSPAQQTAMMRTRLAAMQRTFAGKVLVISEFGAESNTLNPPGPARQLRLSVDTCSRATSRLRRPTPMLSGMLVWDLRDYPLTPTFEGGPIHRCSPTCT